jgi:hypothetical protein
MLFFENYNNGHNIVNGSIIERLQYDANKENISGYNRSSETFEDYFWNEFITSPELFFGDKSLTKLNLDDLDDEVSWMTYIINYGLIAFLFLILYFLYPFIRAKDNRYSKLCLGVLFFLIFAQTIHMTHSLMYVSLFVLSIGNIDYEERMEKTKTITYGNKQ